MKLVIAEKPSVAMSYAKVLGANTKKDGYSEGNGYIVTWCVGHLIELAMPEAYDEKYKKWDMANLPFIPDKWRYAIKKETAKQYKTVKQLLVDDKVNEVVCGTDAGREGELIFRHVYKMSGSKKPIKRLWVSSMEDSALKEGFNNLKNGADYENLYNAALARERIDYLAGMNFSPLVSLLYGGAGTYFSIGRVQTPTLNLVYQRDNDIANFVKEKYYVVHIAKDGLDAVSEHIKEQNIAEKMQKECNGANATVVKAEKKDKKVNMPTLYDLTTLQRDANRLYGFTADKTLKVTQKLYENKLVTYPRTDSAYLTEDMENVVDEVSKKMLHLFNLSADIAVNKHIFNNNKVSDHHAIIPTKADFDINSLSMDEQKIYSLIAMRLLCAMGKPYLYESTSIEISCAGSTFKANSNVIKDKGFKTIEEFFKARYKADKDDRADTKNNEATEINFAIAEGMILENVTSECKEAFTKPQPHFTEDTLLSTMEKAGVKDMSDEVERKGIGTPATRAEIIEKLVNRGYVIREKKNILITDKGKYLVEVAPERIKSIDFTVDMENKLVDLSNGKVTYQAFMQEFNDYISDVVDEYSKLEITDKKIFANGPISDIGNCPLCKSPIREGKTNYYCSNKECKVCLWKEDNYLKSMKKSMTKKIASDFFNKGYSNIKGLVSPSKGTEFDAKVICTFDEEGRCKYNLEFPKKKNNKKN